MGFLSIWVFDDYFRFSVVVIGVCIVLFVCMRVYVWRVFKVIFIKMLLINIMCYLLYIGLGYDLVVFLGISVIRFLLMII